MTAISETGDLDSHPLAAAYYADRAVHCEMLVDENVPVARDTYRIRICSPDLARNIVPGQFVMIRLPGCDDPLLARPFALYDTWWDAPSSKQGRQPMGVDIVYLVVGKMTARLAECRKGDVLEVCGPLGNGFSAEPTDHLIMVAGGIGQTPFLALGREFLGGRQYGQPPRGIRSSERVTLCYGARSAEYLAGIDDFQAAGIDVRVSTDDGTAGHHGLVTELLGELFNESDMGRCRVACCGPEPMMEVVADLCGERRAVCEVSLETPMACGVGICFSCVAKVRQSDGDWDYKRTCVEGPIFDAEKIVW